MGQWIKHLPQEHENHCSDHWEPQKLGRQRGPPEIPALHIYTQNGITIVWYQLISAVITCNDTDTGNCYREITISEILPPLFGVQLKVAPNQSQSLVLFTMESS